MKPLSPSSLRPWPQRRGHSHGFPPFPVRSRFVTLTLTLLTKPRASARKRRSALAGCRLCQTVTRHRPRPDPLRVLPRTFTPEMARGTVTKPH